MTSVEVVHARERLARSRFIRTPRMLRAEQTPGTVCGAEPTTRDLGYVDARSHLDHPALCRNCVGRIRGGL